ncbi:TPA: efflux transporter outer membrane subunit [Pseudomonas aeruginosa]|nr:efflux transporter outer membrane subunit [Pseudomonas aeruginosa]MBV5530498.1 efflux transporter outer membrane subunit [Pseudomonas aeruginosa]HBO2879726.1 efflux transporter outer membrane subunit [Pseudomonas aeruginosa]HEJ3161508.1 efflux transporter outer membrane subunit [Pseudomonas aeruginosa]
MFPLLAGALLAGCAGTMAPRYERPAAPVATEWPVQAASVGGPGDAAGMTWHALFADVKLRQVVQLALENNRDLRVTALNIERARAQYGIQRSLLLPDVGVGVNGDSGRTPASVSPTGSAVTSHVYSANLGISAWEVDLFGRLRSLKDQALQQYLASEATQRATRLGLIAEVAGTYLGMAADSEQLVLARETQRSRQQAYELQRQLRDVGSSSELDLRQAEGELEAARDAVLALETTVATDRNALELLVGSPLPAHLHPDAPLEAILAKQDLPAGIPSDLLQRRPDIIAAEHTLIGANANIGAARAAFFPSISLTAGVGRASDSLSSLFDGGNRAWSFLPQVSLPIFTGGRLQANLDLARVDRDIAVAGYEQAIQSAFRDVADALAVRARIDDRLAAQQSQVAASQQAYTLVQQRYDNGVSSYLAVLDAQRTLFTAQQNLIGMRLARQTNLVTLYKALGGDWSQLGQETLSKADEAPIAQQLQRGAP